MAPPATPTPRPTPVPQDPAPSDRLAVLALGSTMLWVLAWLGIQLTGLR